MNQKILFKKYIKIEYIKEEGNNFQTKKEGTGIYSDYVNEGILLKWGVDGDGEGGSCTCGVVLLPDNTIELIYAPHIKFV